MASRIPSSFHKLAPFQSLFETGLPVLMYHKLGERPRHVRLKGLYVPAKRFARQLEELRDAGFTSVNLDQAAPLKTVPARRIVLTFDDGFCNVLKNGLPLMAQFGFHATMYVVADGIGKFNEWEQREGEAREPLMDKTQLQEWLTAGHQIGSHACSHPFLTRLSIQQAREEIFSSKKKLEDLFGRPVDHFCYPYGDWNEPVRNFVMEAGYRTACTTRFGINTPATNPFELNRILVRHPSRSFKAFKAWLALKF